MSVKKYLVEYLFYKVQLYNLIFYCKQKLPDAAMHQGVSVFFYLYSLSLIFNPYTTFVTLHRLNKDYQINKL